MVIDAANTGDYTKEIDNMAIDWARLDKDKFSTGTWPQKPKLAWQDSCHETSLQKKKQLLLTQRMEGKCTKSSAILDPQCQDITNTNIGDKAT